MNDGEQQIYYTARHLLAALQNLKPHLLDMPLVLIHGKSLHKPHLIQGLLPTITPVLREVVEAKPPSLLTLGELVDSIPLPDPEDYGPADCEPN